MNTTDRREAIVLCADLLGFSDHVRQVVTANDAVKLAAQLESFAEEFSGSDFEDDTARQFFAKKYWAFSDGIVVCWDLGSKAEQQMTDFDAQLHQLSGIACAQAHIMWQNRQIVRGGVARGWMLEQGQTVLGSALVTAASIEKAIGGPFIGVDAALYHQYLNHPLRIMYAPVIEPVQSLFIAPCSYTLGYPALDYFRMQLGEIGLSPNDVAQSRTFPVGDQRDAFCGQCIDDDRASYARWHRDFIVKGLANPDARIRVKYEALGQHHNCTMSQLNASVNDPSFWVV